MTSVQVNGTVQMPLYNRQYIAYYLNRYLDRKISKPILGDTIELGIWHLGKTLSGTHQT
jgi:hypothetical protein